MKNIGPFLAFNKAWFKKNQRILLFLLNTHLIKYWFRWILKINGKKSDVGKNKILEIAPNFIRWANFRVGEFKIEFRTHPKFGKRIYYAFRPFWWLVHFWDWAFADRFVPRWSYGFSTLTAYPAAGSGGTTSDGRMVYDDWPGPYVSFATMVGAASANSIDQTSTADWALIGAGNTTNNFRGCQRTGQTYDTSSLGASANISAAEIDLYGVAQSNGLGSPDLHIGSFAPGSNGTFVVGDYSTVGTTSFANVAYASFSTVGYNALSLNAGGVSNISKTGISKFSVQCSWDINRSFSGTWASGAQSYFQWNSADQTGTANDPKLVVTYSTVTTQIKTIQAKGRIKQIFAPTIQAKGRLKTAGVVKTVTSKARIKQPNQAKTITSKAKISLSGNVKTIQAKGRLKIAGVAKTVTSKARIKQIDFIKTLTAKGRLKIANIVKTATGKAFIVSVGKVTLVSPPNASAALTPIVFIWTIPPNRWDANLNFQIQIDKTNASFGDLEVNKFSWLDAGFEYYDGATWQTVPVLGIPPSAIGKNCRLSLALTPGTKYWRVIAYAG